MKIPKHIDTALKRRTRYAELLQSAATIVDDFILENGMADDIDSADYLGGCEVYVNPSASEMAVRNAILAKEDGK